jgi:hypothetical protein
MSVPQQTLVQVATSNYIAAHGVCAWAKGSGRKEGAFGHDSGARLRDLTDGTSNTILVGERSTLVPGPTALKAGAAIWAGDNTPFNIQFGTTLPSQFSDCVMGLAYAPINTRTGPLVGPTHQYSSQHIGGAHFLLGDGSVQFLSENMHSHIGPNPATDCASAATWGAFQFLNGINEGGIGTGQF